MSKRIIISVVSDLSTDQRVHRAALTLHDAGYEVLLVGRLLKNSLPLNRTYPTRRFKLWFNNGPLFYANYNIRLFFLLLFSKADYFLANDLDTLLPNYLVSLILNVKLIYDSHEYFTGVPELVNRPAIQSIWKGIEKSVFPRLKTVYTVNDSIASLYKQEYKIDVGVIRNLPFKITPTQKTKTELRNELGLPADKFIFIMQGNGINIQRGAEEAVQAVQFVEDAILLIAGNGDVIDDLKKLVAELKLDSKVIFRSRMPYKELLNFTFAADAGLTLDKDTNINYRFSLPNKLFDYIQAGIPVIASDLVEVRKVVEHYEIGLIVKSVYPQEIAKVMNEMMSNDYKLKLYRSNLNKAAAELNWDLEKQKLLSIFKSI